MSAETRTSTVPTPQNERRRSRRITLVTEVRCEALGRDEMLVTRDISEGGAFIATSRPFPAGMEIALWFCLSSAGPLVNCRAAVVNSQPGAGMGVEFRELPPETVEALRKFVQESS